jgi:four helix bundle protein
MSVVPIVKKFQDLEVWKKSFSISLEIHKATLQFPQIEQYALANQMRRASKSICANIAEGFSKQLHSKAEFKRFIQMAMASGNEMIVWMMYAYELGYISSEVYSRWDGEYNSICRMLNSLHSKA